MSGDPIDDLAAAWRLEVPDLDVGPMVTVARLNRLSILVNKRIEDALAANGSSLGEFDVLSALRRQGSPYQLKPSELSRHIMLSPSGITHRVDLLEDAGLVERHLDPTNRRSMPVALTVPGVQLAEKLVRIVVEVEADILGPLTPEHRTAFDTMTSAVLGGLALG